jgi:hypothetical protein
MPNATYHQATGSITLEVIGKPKAGKVDLGRDKEVLVSGVSLSDDPIAGTCTLIDEPKKEPQKPSGETTGTTGTTSTEGNDGPPLV